MTTIAAVLEILALAAVLIGVVVAVGLTIRNDGYGHRPGPRSHRGEGSSPWNPHAA